MENEYEEREKLRNRCLTITFDVYGLYVTHIKKWRSFKCMSDRHASV